MIKDRLIWFFPAKTDFLFLRNTYQKNLNFLDFLIPGLLQIRTRLFIATAVVRIIILLLLILFPFNLLFYYLFNLLYLYIYKKHFSLYLILEQIFLYIFYGLLFIVILVFSFAIFNNTLIYLKQIYKTSEAGKIFIVPIGLFILFVIDFLLHLETYYVGLKQPDFTKYGKNNIMDIPADVKSETAHLKSASWLPIIAPLYNISEEILVRFNLIDPSINPVAQGNYKKSLKASFVYSFPWLFISMVLIVVLLIVHFSIQGLSVLLPKYFYFLR